MDPSFLYTTLLKLLLVTSLKRPQIPLLECSTSMFHLNGFADTSICPIRLVDTQAIKHFCLGQDQEKQDTSPVTFLSFKYFPGIYCCSCCDLTLILLNCNCLTLGFFPLISSCSHPHGDLGISVQSKPRRWRVSMCDHMCSCS